MKLDDDSRYAALRARDPRFDGVFFVGVRTTGIYCRPVCPARLPHRENCTFFGTGAEAERHGYRACLRCRPELAPGRAPVDAGTRLARRAVERIDRGYLNERGVDALAAELGISARHLRRVLRSELGVSPVQLAQTRRLALAKQLLQDTALPLSRVAFASGFGSLRRFNAVFAERFGRPPSAIRRGRSAATPAPSGPSDGVERIPVRLDYRPPLAWAGLLAFLARRATPRIEEIDGDTYRRLVRGDEEGSVGWIEVAPVPDRPSLKASIPVFLVSRLPDVVSRLRRLFDLDARPDVVTAHLEPDPEIGTLVRRRPGLRVPGAFDPFELAIRTVLGQQITVAGATTLCGRLVHAFGGHGGHAFPDPDSLAGTPVGRIAELGMPESRARTIVELSRCVARDGLDLLGAVDPDETAERLESVPGVGPWTAQYILMRACAWPNAFPAADLGIRKVLGGGSAAAVERRSRSWEPWRAYAAVHLWHHLSNGESRDEDTPR